MEDYNINKLKNDIEKMNNHGENLKLIGMIALDNTENCKMGLLYCQLDNILLEINNCVDLIYCNKIENIEEIINKLDEYSSYSFYIEKDIRQEGINKTTPIVKCLASGNDLNLDNSIWTDDFLINNNDKYISIYLNDNFEEVSFNLFKDKILDVANEVFDDKINDYKRLSLLGYDDKQINQIIKSKTIYDIEPFVNIYNSVDDLKKYNELFSNIIDDKYKNILKLCLISNYPYNFLIDNKFSTDVVNFIINKINNGKMLPVEITPEYKLEHVKQIYEMLYENNSINDVNLILNPNFNDEQIYAIRQCLKYLTNKELYWITPEYSKDDIIDIATKQINGQNIKYLLKENKNTQSLDKLITSFSNKFKNKKININIDIGR